MAFDFPHLACIQIVEFKILTSLGIECFSLTFLRTQVSVPLSTFLLFLFASALRLIYCAAAASSFMSIILLLSSTENAAAVPLGWPPRPLSTLCCSCSAVEFLTLVPLEAELGLAVVVFCAVELDNEEKMIISICSGDDDEKSSVSNDIPAIVNATSISKSFKVESFVLGTASFRR